MVKARGQEIVRRTLMEKGDQAGILAFLNSPQQKHFCCPSPLFSTQNVDYIILRHVESFIEIL